MTGAVPPAYVVDHGAVARFVFQAREIYKQTGLPKPSAFSPFRNPELNRHEVSVCGLEGVGPDRLWHLGRVIRAKDKLQALAAIEVPVAQVKSVPPLMCEPAPELPDFHEHGVIVGWPASDEDKDARLALQQELASRIPAAAVHRPPA